MADMLAAGAAWLAGRLQAAAGVTVTYQRGGDGTEVVATIGASRFESMSQSGVLENWESRDYLLPYSDLPYGEPRRGDLIVETIGDDVCIYEVTTPRGVPVFHADAYRAIVRVHTILIEAGVEYLATEAGETLTTESGDLLAV